MSGEIGRDRSSTLSYGIVTRSEEALGWSGIDRDVYEIKGPGGRTATPVSAAMNAVSCFRDDASVEASPDLAQRDADGERPADRGGAAVCPSAPGYRDGVLDVVADAAEVHPDVRVDHIGFARREFCRCDRCVAAADDDWREWRVATVSGFVETVREAVPGRLAVSVHPEPARHRLRERTGVDLGLISEHIDELVVPLYDSHYDTTYWLESLAGGFADAIPPDVGLGVELYAGEVDLDQLLEAVTAVEPYTDTVYFGHGVDTAIAAIRRRRADANGGMVYGP